MNTFCTIVSCDYLPFARVLFTSLQRIKQDVRFQVLVIDGELSAANEPFAIHSPEAMKEYRLFRQIEKKYGHTNKDHFRWALKPIFISYLLENGYSRVIYTDPDIFFTSDYSFLFNKLNKCNILLTPHWPAIRLPEHEDSLFSVLRGGLFNAGFVAAGTGGIEGMHWWAEMCHYKMDKQPQLGIFDDQKYLDILPVYFDGVEIIRHKGCNIASWNMDSCKRELINGRLLINGEFDPVFIHFAKDTIINILNKNDALLRPWLDIYIQMLSEHGFDLLKNLSHYEPAKYDNLLYSIQHRIRLRTRIKRMLFKFAEKI